MAITTTNTDDASASPLLTSIDRLTVASKKAVEVVNRFANIEPPLDDDDDDADLEEEDEEGDRSTNTTTTNPWKNPQVIEEELNIARNELNAAWKNVKAERDAVTSAAVTEAYEVEEEEEEKKEDEDSDIAIPEEEFRVLYMNMMTDAFGDVLETMNQESGQEGKPTVDVDILVDCLQSGIDFLDPVEELNKRSYFDSLDYNFGEDDDDDNDDDKMNDDNDEEGLTIHEMKQRSLGYLVSSSASSS
eukprot:CAMPEP_0170920668 /NCGR_PEP_ID=MMETSP0735-20130129/9358_1 /TAXON_ID=186038 /ORGANISM="Fragilariopsis kerguelensis, Strain L26-C5" /LENGTH=245 /DNA_ID=CAMNT_0011319667 /DNA_START=233 /DNA_END=970 /DNA_ORIENTATION=-